MSIHRMVACRTYFFSWRCVRSAFLVHGVHWHQYPPTDRLHFLKPKVTELFTGLQGDYHHRHRGNDHVRGLHGECAHYPNHRDRPIIRSHLPSALRIYGRCWPQMLSNSKISNAGSGWLVSRPFSLRPDVRFCSINHIERDPIIVQSECHSQ